MRHLWVEVLQETEGDPVSAFEQRLRIALAQAYTAEGVEIVMRSRLWLDDGEPRTWEQYVADGEGDRVLDWAESLTGMVAT